MRTVDAGRSSTELPPVAEPRSVLSRTAPILWVATAVLCMVVLGFYIGHYSFHDLNPVGWDVHAYVWQTKAVGHGSLAEIGARPGLPLLGSVLRSVISIDPSREMVVLPPVLALMLGLASGAMIRMAFRLPPWASTALALMVSLWPMTSRIVFGYQASLMEQILLVAGIGVLAHAEKDRPLLAMAVALFAAAALSHVVFYVVFAGIAGLAAATALPALAAERRAGVPLVHTEAGAISATVLGGGIIGAVALYGWLGIRPGSSVDTSAVSFTYRGRARNALRSLRLPASAPVALVGGALAWISGKSRKARIVIRLGLAWLAVTVGAILLFRLGVVVPASRFIQFALPASVLFGLGVVAVAALVLRRPGVLRRLVVAGVVLVMAAAPSFRQIQTVLLRRHVAVRGGLVWTQLRAAEAYLDRVTGVRPVVFVVNQRGYWGAFTPKLKLYVIRGSVPADDVTRTFVYVGDLAELERGRPTLLPQTPKRWQGAYNVTSLKMWSQTGPALEQGALVLIAMSYAREAFEKAVLQDPSRTVAPGLYVLRGPVIRVDAPPAHRFDAVRGVASAAGFLLILLIAGWGWTRFALRRAAASVLDVAYVAPAIGAALVILVSFVVAAAGGDPGSWPGIAVMAIVALTGGAVARRTGPVT